MTYPAKSPLLRARNGVELRGVILDQFTDTDTTALASHTIGPVNFPATAWNSGAGAWTISSNQVVPNLLSFGHYWCNPGVADGIIRANITLGSTASGVSDDDGIVFRWTDTNNYWWAGLNTVDDVFRIVEKNNGTSTVRATTTLNCAVGQDNLVEVVLDGAIVTARVDGGNQISYSDAGFNRTATKHGMRATRTTARFDNWQFYSGHQSVAPKRLLFIGDSISVGSATNWTYLVQHSYNGGNNSVTNNSNAGDTVEGDMATQVNSAASANAEVVIILLGTNDGDTITQATYQAQLNVLKSNHPLSTIYALGILNCTSGASSGVGERDTVNSRISAAVTAAGGVTYINTDDWIDPATDTSDGLHPTAAGYVLVKTAFLAAIA